MCNLFPDKQNLCQPFHPGANYSLIIRSQFQTASFKLGLSLNYLNFPGFQTYYYLDVDDHLSKVNLFHTTYLNFTPAAFEISQIPQCSLSCDLPQCKGYPNYRDFRNRGQSLLVTAYLLQFLGLEKLLPGLV